MKTTPTTLALLFTALLAPPARAGAPAPDLPDTFPTCPSPQPIAPTQAVAGSYTYTRSNPVWNGREFGVAYVDGNDGRLHFVRVYADGTPAAAPLTLTSRSTSYAPSLVWNGSGYGVAWTELSATTAYYEIYFARLNPDGTMIGSELKVSVAGATEIAPSYSPALAWSGSGYAVAWFDYRNNGTTGADIYATLLDSTGAIANGGASHDLVVCNAANNQFNPAIAWSQGSGLYLAVWEDYRNGGAQIYRATLSPSGAAGGNFQIVSGAGASFAPAIVDSGNGLGLVWYDTRDANDEIYFARLSLTGYKIGADVRLTNDAALSINPRIVWTGGEYGVLWRDTRGAYETWFQRVSQAGAAVGGNIQVTYSGDTELPDLAFGSKGYLITGTYYPGPVLLNAWGCSADTTPPTSCPGNFNAYNITGASATVTWSPSGDAETDLAYYNVYRNNALIGKTSSEYYNDSGLNLSNSYNYMIQPVNAWQLQNNGCTSSIYVRTNSSLTLTMNKANPDAVLNWTDAGFNNYNVFRGADPRVMGQIGATPALTTSDVNALSDSVSYFYSVDNPGQ